MAVSMPGNGGLTALVPRMASSLTLWVPTVHITPGVERCATFAVSYGEFLSYRKIVCKKTRENELASLGY